MLWIAEPYIPTDEPIIFVPGQIGTGPYPVYHSGPFVASLASLIRNSGNIQVADLASDLTVTTSGVGNGTIIECWVYREYTASKTFTTLYFAGLKFIYPLRFT